MIYLYSYLSPSPLSLSLSHTHTRVILCHSLHQIHFQLLLLVSSYIKLLNLLENSIKTIPVTIISTELTGIKQQVESITFSLTNEHLRTRDGGRPMYVV